MRKPVVYTIGHSTLPIAEFLTRLTEHGIEQVVDVRTIPRSRHNPQFDQVALRASLRGRPIRYWHAPTLGGLRHAHRDSLNTGWRNASFRGFADHMQSPAFREALERLEALARRRPTAIMCAEALPWRCHRSLIADALVVDGWRVCHLEGGRRARSHRRTPFLHVQKGRLLYPEPRGTKAHEN